MIIHRRLNRSERNPANGLTTPNIQGSTDIIRPNCASVIGIAATSDPCMVAIMFWVML